MRNSFDCAWSLDAAGYPNLQYPTSSNNSLTPSSFASRLRTLIAGDWDYKQRCPLSPISPFPSCWRSPRFRQRPSMTRDALTHKTRRFKRLGSILGPMKKRGGGGAGHVICKSPEISAHATHSGSWRYQRLTIELVHLARITFDGGGARHLEARLCNTKARATRSCGSSLLRPRS
jgi:hypothetical protein